MAAGENQKLKMLYLVKILSEQTDEEHGLSAQEIIARLEELGVNVERKTLYADLEDLERYGVAIEDISAQTIPEDFSRTPRIHKCYLVRRM